MAILKINTNLLAVGGSYTIKIFNWPNGLNIHIYKGHSNTIYTIVKSCNPNEFFSAGSDKSIIVWD